MAVIGCRAWTANGGHPGLSTGPSLAASNSARTSSADRNAPENAV
ncbi:hypothetical protein [Streptomyces sp. NPDC050388]